MSQNELKKTLILDELYSRREKHHAHELRNIFIDEMPNHVYKSTDCLSNKTKLTKTKQRKAILGLIQQPRQNFSLP